MRHRTSHTARKVRSEGKPRKTYGGMETITRTYLLAYADRSYSRSRGLPRRLGASDGSNRPRRERGEGDNLFTDSVVALDADAGERNSESSVHGLNGRSEAS